MQRPKKVFNYKLKKQFKTRLLMSELLSKMKLLRVYHKLVTELSLTNVTDFQKLHPTTIENKCKPCKILDVLNFLISDKNHVASDDNLAIRENWSRFSLQSCFLESKGS